MISSCAKSHWKNQQKSSNANFCLPSGTLRLLIYKGTILLIRKLHCDFLWKFSKYFLEKHISGGDFECAFSKLWLHLFHSIYFSAKLLSRKVKHCCNAEIRPFTLNIACNDEKCNYLLSASQWLKLCAWVFWRKFSISWYPGTHLLIQDQLITNTFQSYIHQGLSCNLFAIH